MLQFYLGGGRDNHRRQREGAPWVEEGRESEEREQDQVWGEQESSPEGQENGDKQL